MNTEHVAVPVCTLPEYGAQGYTDRDSGIYYNE